MKWLSKKAPLLYGTNATFITETRYFFFIWYEQMSKGNRSAFTPEIWIFSGNILIPSLRNYVLTNIFTEVSDRDDATKKKKLRPKTTRIKENKRRSVHWEQRLCGEFFVQLGCEEKTRFAAKSKKEKNVKGRDEKGTIGICCVISEGNKSYLRVLTFISHRYCRLNNGPDPPQSRF